MDYQHKAALQSESSTKAHRRNPLPILPAVLHTPAPDKVFKKAMAGEKLTTAEENCFMGCFLAEAAELNSKSDWVTQLHLGAVRDVRKTLFYVEDEQITSKFGVDISSHQGIIDWETVKEAGVEFALIRAGYRGYGSGELVEDERFHENMQGAMDAGIEVGVYFFSQAITPEEALEEADLTLSMIEGYEFSYPVIFDWEFVSAAEARTSDISVTGLTDCTVAFCKAIEEAPWLLRW